MKVRTFTERRKLARGAESTGSSTFMRTLPGQDQELNSILQSHDTIGNLAVQQLLRDSPSYEQQGSGHTLELYVASRSGQLNNSPRDDQTRLSARFRRRVQRLLPGNCRLELVWQRPQNEYNSGFYRAELSQTGIGFSSDPWWKHELQRELALSISGPTQRFSLEYGSSVIVGAFSPVAAPGGTAPWPGVAGTAPILGAGIPDPYGRLDILDLERVPDQIAANFLGHELHEQRARQSHGAGFEIAHAEAVRGENDFMGGRRRQDWEHITNGVDFGDPPASNWQWWIPYERPDGSVIAAVLYMRGSNIIRSRLAGFPDLSQLSLAAGRQGLVC